MFPEGILASKAFLPFFTLDLVCPIPLQTSQHWIGFLSASSWTINTKTSKPQSVEEIWLGVIPHHCKELLESDYITQIIKITFQVLTESFVYCYYTDNPLIWNYFFVNLFGLKNLPLTLSTHFDEKKVKFSPQQKKSKSTCYYVNTIMSFFSPILINDWSLYSSWTTFYRLFPEPPGNHF